MTRPLPLLIALLSAFPAGSVFAGPQCASRDSVLATLAAKYGETRRSIGLAANQGMVEVFASGDTGTWTITVTMADGTTCLVASGENYEAFADDLPAKGDPA